MYLPSPIPGHDLATIIHHSIVDCSAVVFNILLLLAVILRSPASLKSYKVLLVNSAILDLIGSFSMVVTMVRIIPARHALAYVYDGPCVFVSGIFCHCIYTVMLATVSQSMFLIACSFGYRLYILGRPTPSNKALSLACFIVSIPNLMILTLFMFALDDPEDVRAELRVVLPEYNLDEYVLEGHVSIFNAVTLFTILALTMPINPTLVLIFIIRKKVLTKLTAHSIQMSGRTAEMHKTLTRVLTLQSMLPIFFSGAVCSYVVCQFDIVHEPVVEHFILEVQTYNVSSTDISFLHVHAFSCDHSILHETIGEQTAMCFGDIFKGCFSSTVTPYDPSLPRPWRRPRPTTASDTSAEDSRTQ